MKRRSAFLLSAVVGLGILVPVWAQRTKERELTPEAMARSLSLDLREARRLLDRVLMDGGPRGGSAREREDSRELGANKRALTDLLERSERAARNLEETLRTGEDRERPLPRGGSVIERPTLSDSQFNELVFSVRQARSSGDKMRVIRAAGQREWVTTRQLRSLIPLLEPSRDQEETAALFYRRLTDPDRFYTIRDVFRSSGSWDSVLRRLGVR